MSQERILQLARLGVLSELNEIREKRSYIIKVINDRRLGKENKCRKTYDELMKINEELFRDEDVLAREYNSIMNDILEIQLG